MPEETKKAQDEHDWMDRYSTPEWEEYFIKRRWKWSDWGSPVGLGLAWALLVIPLGVLIYLLHLSGIV